MFIVMHDRDQKHVVIVDGINRFTTLLSLLQPASLLQTNKVFELIEF